jgi:drug/metabolite transporter (DMT)-like permease
MKHSNAKIIILLNIMLMIYSMSGICSKLAAKEKFLSKNFCIYYMVIIVLLVLYAVGWQQVIKRLPLTTAFANKAVTIVWGVIWGAIFFGEVVTIGKIVGALFVITGVVMYAKEDGVERDE